MSALDKLLLKDTWSQKTMDIEEDNYEILVDMAENSFESSASKLINLCIYDLAERVHAGEKKDEWYVIASQLQDLGKHSVILRDSARKELKFMKKKLNIPLYGIINISIREGIPKMKKMLKR